MDFPGGVFHLLTWLLLFPTNHAQTKPPKLVILTFDGISRRLLDKVDLPNMKSFIKEGVQIGEVIPQFPSIRVVNHYSMFTGLYPESHGVLMGTMFDPTTSKYLTPDDEDFYDYDTAVLPIWESNDLASGNRKSRSITIRNGAEWMRQTRENIDMMQNEVPPVNLLILDFPLVYHTVRQYGSPARQTEEALKQVDVILGYVKERLIYNRIWETTNVIVTSTFGMVDVPKSHVIQVDFLGNATGKSPVLGFTNLTGNVTEFYNGIKSEENHFKVYLKQDIPDRYHMKHNERAPDVLVEADESYAFQDFNEMSASGYDNSLDAVHTFMVARGPSFVPGSFENTISIVDIFPLMCRLLTIKPQPNNGTIDLFYDVLKEVDDLKPPPSYKEFFIFLSVMITIVGIFGIFSLHKRYKNRKLQKIYSSSSKESIEEKTEERYLFKK